MSFEGVVLACLANTRLDTVVVVAAVARHSVVRIATRTTFAAQPALPENQRRATAFFCRFAMVLHRRHLVGLHGWLKCHEEDETLPECKLRSEAMPGT